MSACVPDLFTMRIGPDGVCLGSSSLPSDEAGPVVGVVSVPVALAVGMLASAVGVVAEIGVNVTVGGTVVVNQASIVSAESVAAMTSAVDRTSVVEASDGDSSGVWLDKAGAQPVSSIKPLTTTATLSASALFIPS
jgi:hypothetical protein